MADLELMDEGTVLDLFIEHGNDDGEETTPSNVRIANQGDFDKF